MYELANTLAVALVLYLQIRLLREQRQHNAERRADIRTLTREVRSSLRPDDPDRTPVD